MKASSNCDCDGVERWHTGGTRVPDQNQQPAALDPFRAIPLLLHFDLCAAHDPRVPLDLLLDERGELIGR
jgi:hypothetical protein